MKFLDRFESVLIDQIVRPLADDIFSICPPDFERDAAQRAPTSIPSKSLRGPPLRDIGRWR
jgi:hypothetical protein